MKFDEIKFRGKRKNNGKWVYGSLIIEKTENNMVFYFISTFLSPNTRYTVYPETIGLYTGKKDKINKEIYEGDLLEGEDGYIYEIKFKENCLIAYGHSKYEGRPNFEAKVGNWLDLCEIIGNIYDNHKLLNEVGKISEKN